MTVRNRNPIKAIITNSIVTISVIDVLGKPVENARVYIADMSSGDQIEIINDLTNVAGKVTFKCPTINILQFMCRVRKPQYEPVEFKLDDDTSECDITITMKTDSIY